MKIKSIEACRLDLPGRAPGTPHETWIKGTAEDSSWGVGVCHWGPLVGPLVREHYAPLLIGRDCMALEFLNDLM